MSIRPLRPAEADAFRLARLAAVAAMPYFAAALFAMTPVARPGSGTFGVDPRWRVYMDPACLVGPDAWPARVAGAVLLHEIGHLIRDHAARADQVRQPVHKVAWNLAGDAEINDDLIAAGVMLPGQPVTPEGLGLPPRELAEQYYDALLQRGEQALAGLDDGGDGCGSGAGSEPVPGELPAAATPAGMPGISPADADLVRRRVAEDVSARRDKSRGTTPAGLARWADETLRPPAVPWQEVLRGAVRAAVAWQAGRIDYTYRRPSRRRVPRVIKPAMRAPLTRVAIVVDTSGSMGEDELGAALSEVDGVLRAGGVARDQVRVLCCDAASSEPQWVRSVSDVRLEGGGGTDMRVGIDAALSQRPRPDVIVVLSDGFTPWPDAPIPGRLVCAIISPDEPAGTPDWATTVHVPTAA